RKVPLLGDVPLLGRLFKSTSRDREKLNLLVFLRPTVIRDEKSAQAATQRKYRDIWQVEIISSGNGGNPEDLFRGRPRAGGRWASHGPAEAPALPNQPPPDRQHHPAAQSRYPARGAAHRVRCRAGRTRRRRRSGAAALRARDPFAVGSD